MTYKITIYEAFINQELTGTFSAPDEKRAKDLAKEFYAQELDTEPQMILIKKIVEVLPN